MISVPKFEVRLTRTAWRDLSGVMEWSVKEFGKRGALRYDALVKQALRPGHTIFRSAARG